MTNIKELFANTSLDRTDAKVLMAHVCQKTLGWPKSSLISRDTDELSTDAIELWLELEAKRSNGEPVAYLVGHREFHEIDLLVAPGVLIPRPETELLVDIGIGEVNRLHANGKANVRALDLGTGSGAIALALAHAITKIKAINIEIIAIDQSLEALAIAKNNCARLHLDSVVTFKQSNWFEQIELSPFEIILSNPPYIPLGDSHLNQGDLRFEPQSALTDHKDGLEAYRSILNNAHQYLSPNGLLAVEHGFDQGLAIYKLFQEKGFRDIQTVQDLSGHDRVTQGRISQ